ncbi:phosphatidylserine decarboxylase [Rhizophagus clarus]|uniref:Phosphatidylserine decarboxylase n=1 Tax=Rhizophagus clarus TaxID=94130 RepID=A0A8H3L3K7_9GLOM|nr:phosphatidylserine decarboxylase [Rhizophagus clarus]
MLLIYFHLWVVFQIYQLTSFELRTLNFTIGVLAARDLAAADKDGFSDPYAVIRIANKKYETAVIKKTLNPVWNSSFDIKLSETNVPPHITITVWDEDRFGRDFLGEITIPIKQIFARNNGGLNDGLPRAFDDPANQPAAYTLQKRTAKNVVKASLPDKIYFRYLRTII